MEVVNKLSGNILEMTLFFCAATSSNSLSPGVLGGGHDTPFLYSLGYHSDIKSRYDIIEAPSNVLETLYLIRWLFCCCVSAARRESVHKLIVQTLHPPSATRARV